MTEPTPTQQPRPEEDEIDLGYLFAICLDNRWRILLVTALVTLAGIAYSLLATPEYQADALLQVESNERNLGQMEMATLGQQTPQSSTQSEILRSRMIMRRAAAQAGLDTVVRPVTFPVIGEALRRNGVERPGFVESGASVWAGETINVASLNTAETLQNQPLTLRVLEAGRYELETENGETLGQGRAGEPFTRDTPYVELRVSEIEAPAGAEFILVKRSETAMIRNLQSRFQVNQRGDDTGILEITLSGTDPRQIQRSLDAIAQVYLTQNINRQAAEAENRLEFLEEQAPEVREELRESEEELNRYRNSRDSVDLSFETQSMLERLVEIEGRLNELEIEENELSRRFTESHPRYETLLQQRQQLQDERQRLEEQVNNLPETQREVLRLQRDVSVTQEIYTQMLNNMQELRIARAGTVGNVRILDEALASSQPIAPRRELVILVSMTAGLLLGLMLVLVRHMLRRGVESVDQVQAAGLQVYATIPLSEKQGRLDRLFSGYRKGSRQIRLGGFRIGLGGRQARRRRRANEGGMLTWKEPGDLAVEALRSLRTSLHFAMLEAKNNVLMLTGPSPGVGKSFISANLAAVCAQAGQRVLLIDGDMRKGHIHELLEGESESGLSDLLVGKIDQATAIRSTDDENLYFMARGTAPPNPSELLMSEGFTRFLEQASQQYDLVLIDTPPVLAVTDAAVVGKQAGTTLLITRFQQSGPKEIERATEQLRSAGTTVKGAILNAVEKTATAYYGYGYGYYHYEYKPEP